MFEFLMKLFGFSEPLEKPEAEKTEQEKADERWPVIYNNEDVWPKVVRMYYRQGRSAQCLAAFRFIKDKEKYSELLGSMARILLSSGQYNHLTLMLKGFLTDADWQGELNSAINKGDFERMLEFQKYYQPLAQENWEKFLRVVIDKANIRRCDFHILETHLGRKYSEDESYELYANALFHGNFGLAKSLFFEFSAEFQKENLPDLAEKIFLSSVSRIDDADALTDFLNQLDESERQWFYLKWRRRLLEKALDGSKSDCYKPSYAFYLDEVAYPAWLPEATLQEIENRQKIVDVLIDEDELMAADRASLMYFSKPLPEEAVLDGISRKLKEAKESGRHVYGEAIEFCSLIRGSNQEKNFRIILKRLKKGSEYERFVDWDDISDIVLAFPQPFLHSAIEDLIRYYLSGGRGNMAKLDNMITDYSRHLEKAAEEDGEEFDDDENDDDDGEVPEKI